MVEKLPKFTNIDQPERIHLNEIKSTLAMS